MGSRWLVLGTILCNKCSYELASLHWQDRRTDPSSAQIIVCLTQIKQDHALNSLATCGNLFYSADREIHELCSLFKCHYKRAVEWVMHLPMCI